MAFESSDRRKVIKRMLLVIIPLLLLFQLLYFINYMTGNLTAKVVEEAELIKQGRDMFSKEDTAFFCDDYEKDLEFRRELLVYEMNETDASGRNQTKYISLINFYIQNKRGADLTDVSVKEQIPKSLTGDAKNLKFTIEPASLSGNSIIFRFDKIKKGETKIVGYSIDKKVSRDILDDYDAPEIITKKVYEGPVINRSIIVAIFIIILLIALFLGFKHFIRPKLLSHYSKGR